ncbi:PAS/PAC sensor signal transduction histidine kinase [Cylindrospermum sp. NIES-4074]|nr:PAS/PAC sensor signal transduction histidine kinase [Cylindrospermum sp. NIES-4074]
MSTESLYQEITALRLRVAELEKALLSVSVSVQLQDALETVRELQHKLSFLVQCNPLGVISWDTEFEVTDWNPAAEAIFGYSKQEALGRNATALLAPESDKEDINQVFAALLKQEDGICSTYTNFTKEGKIITCEWYNTPVIDLDGKVIGILSMVKDITISLQTEAQIQNYQQFMKSIIDMLPLPFFVKETVDLRIVLLNRAFEELSGFSAAELMNKSNYDIHSKEKADLFTDLEYEVIKSQKVLEFPQTNAQNIRGEIRIVHHKTIPVIDAQDKCTHLLFVTEDITERQLAKAALAKSEAQFRSLVENANDVIYSLSIDGLFTYLSPNFTNMFGYDTSEFLGQSFTLLVNPDDLATYQAFFQQIANTGKKQAGLEVRIRRKDGSDCWILSNSSPVTDTDGKLIGFQGITRDINERKTTEEALKQSEAQFRRQALELEETLQELQRTQAQLIQSEKMSSLGQLVAGVAHEINNPVSFIYGNLTHAQEYTEDLLNLLSLYQQNYPHPISEIQEQVEAIDLDYLLQDLPKLYSSMKVGAERIRQIVTSLRTFSRLDEADLKPADIHEGIDSTLMILEHRLRAKPNFPEITVIKEYGRLPLVECYAGQLNQVFLNILANAIDALEESVVNSKTINNNPEIRICTEMPDAQQIVIRIADNGLGVSEQVRPRLFDPFYTTKAVGKGTGMGLSICYQIITERHGGSLSCISLPEKGAEFVIEIPLQQSPK